MLIPLPNKLDIKETKGNKATIVIEPCYPGYGVTLGNALRRVLLSSIEGSAIIAFKIKGAHHEFSSLPNVKEDLVEIILNIKKIRLRVFSDEPIILNLNASGEKAVTADDIDKNAQVEIINPSAHILTLTSLNASISMEFTAKKGMGYVTVEDRAKEKVDLGTMIIDAIYSPIVNVGFDIDNIRVGERTDYERLSLKIETDGSINPKDALLQASEILVKHFQFVGELSSDKKTKSKEKNAEQEIASAIEDIEKNKPCEFQNKSIISEAKAPDKLIKKRGRPKKSE